MSIQSKSARVLTVVSVLALALACGEGAEGAEGVEQQESPAQMAPDSLKEQDAALSSYCPGCKANFLGVGANGRAEGWMCSSGHPNTLYKVILSKWNGYTYKEIGRGRADEYNGVLSSVCGGSPYHQFNIYVGPWNAGPGLYRLNSYARDVLVFERTFTR